jgi:P-type Ca2+ transporter type 2C
LAHIAVIYWGPLQWVFRTAPLNFNDWLWIIGISLSVIVVVEIDKAIRRWHQRRTQAKAEALEAAQYA